MPKLDIPLDALKLVSQNIPVEQGSHSLQWTEENGFVLTLNMGGQFIPVRFDYGETLEDIKKEIQMITGVPMPEEEKASKGKAPYKPPQEGIKEASMRTPLLDKIAATLPAGGVMPVTRVRPAGGAMPVRGR